MCSPVPTCVLNLSCSLLTSADRMSIPSRTTWGRRAHNNPSESVHTTDGWHSDRLQPHSSTGAVDLNLGCKGLWVMPPEHGFPLKRGWSDVNKRVLCGPTWAESPSVSFREVGAVSSDVTLTEEADHALLTPSITSWFNFPCLGVVWETQWTSSESLPADTRINTYAPPELWAQTLVQFLELLFERKRK